MGKHNLIFKACFSAILFISSKLILTPIAKSVELSTKQLFNSSWIPWGISLASFACIILGIWMAHQESTPLTKLIKKSSFPIVIIAILTSILQYHNRSFITNEKRIFEGKEYTKDVLIEYKSSRYINDKKKLLYDAADKRHLIWEKPRYYENQFIILLFTAFTTVSFFIGLILDDILLVIKKIMELKPSS